MSFIEQKTPSYLVKHRRKWQVKLTIPKDVRWAFENKTTFKRSTGCDIIDVGPAIIERDKIVAKFKAVVAFHRSGTPKSTKNNDIFGSKFNGRSYLKDHQVNKEAVNTKRKAIKSAVEGWIKERLLNKSKNTPVLRYDFWNTEKKNKI